MTIAIINKKNTKKKKKKEIWLQKETAVLHTEERP